MEITRQRYEQWGSDGGGSFEERSRPRCMPRTSSGTSPGTRWCDLPTQGKKEKPELLDTLASYLSEGWTGRYQPRSPRVHRCRGERDRRLLHGKSQHRRERGPGSRHDVFQIWKEASRQPSSSSGARSRLATDCPQSRRAVGVAARSRRDLDHRQRESLPFICEWVGVVAPAPLPRMGEQTALVSRFRLSRFATARDFWVPSLSPLSHSWGSGTLRRPRIWCRVLPRSRAEELLVARLARSSQTLALGPRRRLTRQTVDVPAVAACPRRSYSRLKLRVWSALPPPRHAMRGRTAAPHPPRRRRTPTPATRRHRVMFSVKVNYSFGLAG